MAKCEDKSNKISIDSFIYWYPYIQSQSLRKEHTTVKLRNRYGFTYVDIRDSIVEAIVSGLYVRECCFCLNNRKKKTEISTPAKDCDIIVEEGAPRSNNKIDMHNIHILFDAKLLLSPDLYFHVDCI